MMMGKTIDTLGLKLLIDYKAFRVSATSVISRDLSGITNSTQSASEQENRVG